MDWIDIGINLTNRRYDVDRSQVIAEAKNAGVGTMIITGTSVASSRLALSMAAQLADNTSCALFTTAGCHPHEASSLDASGLEELQTLLKNPLVVAVGECGLDFNRDFSPREQQLKAFEQQLALAVDCQKPVFLHERDAFDTQYAILKSCRTQLSGAVVHCFTGEEKQLAQYLELDCYIGITGWVCDERRGQALYNMLKLIPDDRLLLETDGPYLTPRDLKPKPRDGRNEPKFLPHIAQTIARAREQSIEHIAEISHANSLRLFNLQSERP